jgi:hypothetical protein
VGKEKHMEDETQGSSGPFVVLAPGTIASDFALKDLNAALGKAQNEFLPATKDAENAYGGWKYTPLEVLIKAVRPSLTKFHLTVSQFPVTDLETKTITVYTRIVHWDSGEWMQNALELPGELALGKGGVAMFNQQTIGGSQTYGQKYAYKAIVGIPDSEEMIDSTDEKGDLPGRSKAKPVPAPTQPPRTEKLIEITRKSTNTGVWSLVADRLTCVPIAVEYRKTGKDQPFLAVTWNGKLDGLTWGSCFDTKLFDALYLAKGLECQIRLKQNKKPEGDVYFSIIDVFSVNGIAYANGVPATEENPDADPE